MRRAGVALAVALLAGTPATLRAQGAGDHVPAQLSLEDAVRLALAHNPDYLGALTQRDAANASHLQSVGSFLPRVDASMGFSGADSRVVTGTDDFGNPIRREDPLNSRFSSSSQFVGLDFTLLDGGTRFHQLSAANAQIRAADATGAAQRATVTSLVSQRYYLALRDARLIALAEQQLASAREQLDATRRRFAVAAADRIDVLGAEGDVANAEAALEEAHGTANKSKLDLLQAIGIALDTAFSLTSEPLAVFDPSTLDADSLVQLALTWSPNVAASRATLSANSATLSAAHSQRWPTISARAGWSRGLNLPGYDAIFEFNPPDRTYSFGLNVSLPIFSQFQTQAAVGQAAAARDRAEQDLRRQQLQTERDVRAALIDLRNAYRREQTAERAVQLSRERVELARQKYQVGAIDFTQLQAVVDRAQQDERNAVEALFTFVVARVTLEEKLGRSVGPDR
ncbi:MAG TPA: TolC family protein [Gemmatimonadaceae bacterium]|nr:TolC family protein [Gemmatimonadaceae bacterium]